MEESKRKEKKIVARKKIAARERIVAGDNKRWT